MPMLRPPSLLQSAFWICALVLLTRLPAMLHRRAINDEAYYALVANEMLHGGLPYRDAVDRKPPLLFSIYWAVFRVAGFPNWIALHAVAVAWTLATMGLLYALGARLFTPWIGVLAAALYGAFQPLFSFSNLAFNGELIMNLPASAAMLLALQPGRSREPLALAAAGALVAIAFLCKQPSGIVLLPLLVYCLHAGEAPFRSPRSAGWWQSGLVLGGFGLVMGITALVLNREGILGEAWYWSVRDHDLSHGPLDPTFWRIVARTWWLFLAAAGPLLLGCWWSLRKETAAWRGRRAERDALIVWLFASLIGVSASGRFFGHYFIQLLPPLALLAAPAFARCWPAVDEARSPMSGGFRLTLLAWSGFSILISLGVALYDGQLRNTAVPPGTVWLQRHSRPGDRLFVWGQDPHIYLDSGLRPASRYIASFPLTGYVFGLPESWDPAFDTSKRIAPDAWDHLAEDFVAHPPQYILDTDAARAIPRYPIAKYAYLADRLQREYSLVFQGSDGLIYSRRQ
jgi:4-amino-4-deoxy-L-arabinose transferase-like glycosyltransferase